MATAVYKQMTFPLLQSVSTPPPDYPDPYQFVFFGVFDDGNGLKLYICNDGLTWTEATLQEQIDNVPKYDLSDSKSLWSKTDSIGNIIDLRLLTHELFKIEDSGADFYEHVAYEKPINSDAVSMNLGYALLPDNYYLLTREK